MVIVQEAVQEELVQEKMQIESNWWMKPIVRDLDKQMADVTFMDAEP